MATASESVKPSSPFSQAELIVEAIVAKVVENGSCAKGASGLDGARGAGTGYQDEITYGNHDGDDCEELR
jgi:hypothetical protein